MPLHNLAALLPPLAPGEAPCRGAATLGPTNRTVILSASLGALRRAGAHWYGPEKSAPFPARAIKTLLAARLLYAPTPNVVRITLRGKWCARTLCSAIQDQSVHPAIIKPEETKTAMAHRRLTEACIHALHEISNGPTAIYNRTIATNLRAVERAFPEFIRIKAQPSRDQAGARPYFAAELTARGRDYITPRKLRKIAEVQVCAN